MSNRSSPRAQGYLALSVDSRIERGELGAVTGWLAERVHAQGARLSTLELVQQVTDKPLSAAPALDQALADSVKGAGLKLYVWTVNDPMVARRLIDLGVDGITTDRPAWLRQQLTR